MAQTQQASANVDEYLTLPQLYQKYYGNVGDLIATGGDRLVISGPPNTRETELHKNARILSEAADESAQNAISAYNPGLEKGLF